MYTKYYFTCGISLLNLHKYRKYFPHKFKSGVSSNLPPQIFHPFNLQIISAGFTEVYFKLFDHHDHSFKSAHVTLSNMLAQWAGEEQPSLMLDYIHVAGAQAPLAWWFDPHPGFQLQPVRGDPKSA